MSRHHGPAATNESVAKLPEGKKVLRGSCRRICWRVAAVGPTLAARVVCGVLPYHSTAAAFVTRQPRCCLQYPRAQSLACWADTWARELLVPCSSSWHPA